MRGKECPEFWFVVYLYIHQPWFDSTQLCKSVLTARMGIAEVFSWIEPPASWSEMTVRDRLVSLNAFHVVSPRGPFQVVDWEIFTLYRRLSMFH